MNDKPMAITAKEFVEQGYAAKVAAGECVVLSSDNEAIESVKKHTGKWAEYDLYDTHTKDGDYFRLSPHNKFSVTWLPQAPTGQPEAEGGV